MDSIGIVCGIRSSEDVPASGRSHTAVTLAIQFVRLSAADELVVASLLSEGRTPSRQLRVTAALVVQEGEESLIDAGSQQTVSAPPAVMQLVRGPERPRRERRRQQRVVVGLSTEVSLRTRTGGRPLSAAMTTDLSANGACVQLSAEDNLLGSELELRWLSSTPLQGSLPVPILPTVCSIVGEVVWTRPAAPDTRPGCVPVAGRTVLAGVRFLPVAKPGGRGFCPIRQPAGVLSGTRPHPGSIAGLVRVVLRAVRPSVPSSQNVSGRPASGSLFAMTAREATWRPMPRLWCWRPDMERASAIMWP